MFYNANTIAWKHWFTQLAEWLFSIAIVSAAVCGILQILGIVKTSLDTIDILTLAFAIALGYITTIRPALRKPELRLIPEEDEQYWSPTNDGSDGGSWSLRMRVVNCGLNPARNCVGRMIDIYDVQSKRLKKFDPLTLYWQRQDGTHTKFEPIDIQGYGDIAILDIAKIEKREAVPIKLRVVLNLDLANFPESYPSPGNKPNLREGIYYIRVSIHGDDVNIQPSWFEITCYKIEPYYGSESSPCRIISKTPTWASSVS